MKKIPIVLILLFTTLSAYATPTCEITYHQFFVKKHCHIDDANYCKPVILSKELSKETVTIETPKDCYDTTRTKILDFQANKKVSQHLYFASYVFTGNPPPTFKITDKDGSITFIEKPEILKGVLDERSDPEFPGYTWYRGYIDQKSREEGAAHDFDVVSGGLAGGHDSGQNYIDVGSSFRIYPCTLEFLYRDAPLKEYKHASAEWNAWEQEFFSWISKVNPSFVRMNAGEYISAETDRFNCEFLSDVYFDSFKKGMTRKFPNQDINLLSYETN